MDTHLAQAGDIAHAVVPMGMLLAWCVNLQLVSEKVLCEHDSLLLRVRFQEATGSELLVACGGSLDRDLFTSAGQRFLDSYYPSYMVDFESVFGEDFYQTVDNWDNYQLLAGVLTRKYLGQKPTHHVGIGGVLEGLARGWRRLWRTGR